MLFRPIFWILLLALVLRLWGIGYGLPLMLVNDEPAVILGAFKMLELKTLVPARHDAEFRKVLYYPPLPSQVLAVAMTPVIGAHYLFFGAPPLTEYKARIALDPSILWLSARVFAVILGLAGIAVAYRLALTITAKRMASLFAAVFLALSLYHIYLSQTVRHWMPAAVLITFLWLLAVRIRESRAGWRTYLLAGLIGGLTAGGVNTASAVGMIPVAMAHLFPIDSRPWRERIFSPKLAVLVLTFVIVALAFVALYPYGFTRAEGASGPVEDVAGRFARLSEATVSGWASFLFAYASLAFRYETALLLLGILGLAMAFRDRGLRFWAFSFVAYAILYLTLLYLFFNMIPRGLIFILPLLAVFAGLAADRLLLWFQNSIRLIALPFAICALLFFGWQFVSDLRYLRLLTRPDTRLEAREWIGRNIPAGTKLLLDAQYLRLFPTAESVRRLEVMAPSGLRAQDRAVASLPEELRPRPAYDVLNLHFLPEDRALTFADLGVLGREGFRYFAVEYALRDKSDLRPETRSLLEALRPLKRFDPWPDESRPASLSASGELASASLPSLFELRRFGRFVEIYELPPF